MRLPIDYIIILIMIIDCASRRVPEDGGILLMPPCFLAGARRGLVRGESGERSLLAALLRLRLRPSDIRTWNQSTRAAGPGDGGRRPPSEVIRILD